MRSCQSARGPLSIFLTEWKTSPGPDPTWDGCKGEIKSRFGTLIDKIHALNLMSNILTGVAPFDIAFQSARVPLSIFLTEWKTSPGPDPTWDGWKGEIKSRFGALIDKNHALNSRHCREWLRAVEKLAILTGVAPFDIAFQSARGPLSIFLTEWKTSPGPDPFWEGCKGEIKSRFGALIDKNHALNLMSNYSQGNQSIQIFSTYLKELAADAYSQEEMALPPVQRHLVDLFTNNLRYRKIQWQVLKSSPATLSEVINIAVKAQNLQDRFALRTQSLSAPSTLRRVICWDLRSQLVPTQIRLVGLMHFLSMQ